MLFGSVTEGVNDFVSKFIVNQDCSDVGVMFDSGIAQDSTVNKSGARDRGRYRFGSVFGFRAWILGFGFVFGVWEM